MWNQPVDVSRETFDVLAELAVKALLLTWAEEGSFFGPARKASANVKKTLDIARKL